MKRFTLGLTFVTLICAAACSGETDDGDDEVITDTQEGVELDPTLPIYTPPAPGTCGHTALVYSPSSNLTGVCCSVNGHNGSYQPFTAPGFYRCTY
jgi:hypothetical protein